MTRTSEAAIAVARGWLDGSRPFDFNGMCLKIVRTAFDIPAAFESAEDAWYGARHKHPFGGNYSAVPRGVAFFWTNGRYGHVVLTLGDGKCLTNDLAGPGAYTVAALSTITNQWGQTPRGWTEDLNGVTYYRPPEDDMQLSDKLYPKQDTSPTVGDALRAAVRLEKAERARAERLQVQVAALREAVDANASPAEVKRLLNSLDVALTVVVNEATEV